MKRSEMIENISDIIENAFPETCENYCELVSKSILDMIEHVGMLPPEYFEEPIEYDNYGNKIPTVEWEPENDND